MKLRVVRIGNSRGIRIPKALLDRLRIADTVEATVRANRIVITPTKKEARAGWEEAAAAMHAAGDDEMFLPDAFPDDEVLDW